VCFLIVPSPPPPPFPTKNTTKKDEEEEEDNNTDAVEALTARVQKLVEMNLQLQKQSLEDRLRLQRFERRLEEVRE